MLVSRAFPTFPLSTMQIPVVLLIICCFSSHFFELHTSCFAQYDRIGNTYEQIRDADFYKKPGHKYPERIGGYGEEQNRIKGPSSKQSINDSNGPSSGNKLINNSNSSDNNSNNNSE